MIARAALAIAALVLAQTAAPNLYRSLENGGPVRNAGHLRGVIVSVDYAGAQIVLREKNRARAIAIVPNTTIVRHASAAALSDLRVGMRVSVAAYDVAGRLVAQTIRIDP